MADKVFEFAFGEYRCRNADKSMPQFVDRHLGNVVDLAVSVPALQVSLLLGDLKNKFAVWIPLLLIIKDLLHGFINHDVSDGVFVLAGCLLTVIVDCSLQVDNAVEYICPFQPDQFAGAQAGNNLKAVCVDPRLDSGLTAQEGFAGSKKSFKRIRL